MQAYVLTHERGELELPLHPATEGPSGLDVGRLLTETGRVTLDSGFANTASCTSSITYIDGDAGVLRYRGYPIEQLAQESNFLEVSYLLIYGALPTQEQLDDFRARLRRHTLLHEEMRQFFDGFPRDAHPMAVLSSAVSALSTFYHSIRSTASTSRSPRSACWPSCRRSPRTPTRSPSASRSCTRTTR
jgi:citrate synthase